MAVKNVTGGFNQVRVEFYTSADASRALKWIQNLGIAKSAELCAAQTSVNLEAGVPGLTPPTHVAASSRDTPPQLSDYRTPVTLLCSSCSLHKDKQ
jgi:hypothetical protein